MEKIESSKQVHYIKQTQQHNSSTNLCKFSESQKNDHKNDTTEKIESSKRTNGFIIKNKLNTTVVVLIYANFLPRISEK